MLTSRQLKSICAKCRHAEEYAPLLWEAMEAGQIDTVTRGAGFIAQLAYESAEFNHLAEQSTGTLYEGRHDLGNVQPGDGPRFKGRGFIQLTGRNNYRHFGKLTGLDLENRPELAEQPGNAARIAAAYWTEHDCNRLADSFEFGQITKTINGGYNGHMDRIWFFHRALEVLGAGVKL